MTTIKQALNIQSISAGIVAVLFGCTGPVLILVGAAEAGQLTDGQTVAWLFSTYMLGGVISIGMALHYKQPICGAWSIPGAAILVAALADLPFSDAVGAFIMSGFLVLALGSSGLIGKLMDRLPMPIIMAMIAGALIRFGIGTVDAVVSEPVMAGLAALAFFISIRFLKKVPPVLVAALIGFGIALLQGAIIVGDIDIVSVAPVFTAPAFSLDAFLAISLPLTILVIGAENAQAMGVLMAEGYKPPVNAMTIVSGVGGIVAGCLGGHNANIAGPMTAICSSPQAGDDTATRYGAPLVVGVSFCVFALFAGAAVPLIQILPKALIISIAGLAMINVLLSAFQQAFNEASGYQFGAFVALIVAMSKFTVFGISSPFWALAAGMLLSTLLNEKVQKRKHD